MHPAAGAGRHLRGRRGPRGRPQSGWPSLSPAERAVAGLVADGLTNPQIGDRLYISRRTVQTHLVHVFAKLDIASRARARDLLTSHIEALKQLTAALVEQETITGDQVRSLVQLCAARLAYSGCPVKGCPAERTQ